MTPFARPVFDRLDLDDERTLDRIGAFNAARRDTDYLSRPLILLGAGSVLAQPFVRDLVKRCNVIALIDNARAGQTLDSVPYSGNDTVSDLLRKTPDAIGIYCCGSHGAITHFRAVWGDAPHPLLSWFQVLFDYPDTTNRGSRLEALSTFYDTDQIRRQHQLAATYLHDPLSLMTLDALMLYRLTWDDRYLSAVARPESAIYFEAEVMPLSAQEVLIDAGAFDGDTVRSFVNHSGARYRHIHAFELDPANVESFEAKTGHIDRVTLHAHGLWSAPAELPLAPYANNGSHITHTDTSDNTVMVRLDALDNCVDEATLIKFDVEGAEAHVLEGARTLIQSHKPKLAISAYHLPDDFGVLHDKVMSIRDDYNFKMRHYSPLVFDTVLYAF